MRLDIPTITVIASIAFVVQTFAVCVQYAVNKTWAGLGWWPLGIITVTAGLKEELEIIIVGDNGNGLNGAVRIERTKGTKLILEFPTTFS